MSRHYNTQHQRNRKAPRKFGHLEDLDTLRRKQLARQERTGSPFPEGDDGE